MFEEILEKLKELKKSAQTLSLATSKDKNDALKLIAGRLNEYRKEILLENAKDVELARQNGVKESLIDRLKLSDKKVDEMIQACETVISLKDPLGEGVKGSIMSAIYKVYKKSQEL